MLRSLIFLGEKTKHIFLPLMKISSLSLSSPMTRATRDTRVNEKPFETANEHLALLILTPGFWLLNESGSTL